LGAGGVVAIGADDEDGGAGSFGRPGWFDGAGGVELPRAAGGGGSDGGC
jgi:hypothetical protein